MRSKGAGTRPDGAGGVVGDVGRGQARRFDPVLGHEQGRLRPALIVSADGFNGSRADLITVHPITGQPKRLPPSRVRIAPPEGGLRLESWVIWEQVRTLSKQHFSSRLGVASPSTLRAIAENLRLLLDL